MFASIRSTAALMRQTLQILRKQFRQHPAILLFTPIISMVFTFGFYLVIRLIMESATSLYTGYLFTIMFWMVSLLSVQLFANILLEQMIEQEFEPQAARLDIFGRAKGLRDVGRRLLAIVFGVLIVVLFARLKLYTQYQALIIGLVLLLNALLLLAVPMAIYSRAINGKPIFAKTPQALRISLANLQQLGATFAWRMIGLLILIPYDWLITKLVFSRLDLILESDNGFLLLIMPLLLVPILSIFILAMFLQLFYGLLEHLRFLQLSDQAKGTNTLSRSKAALKTHPEPETIQQINLQQA